MLVIWCACLGCTNSNENLGPVSTRQRVETVVHILDKIFVNTSDVRVPLFVQQLIDMALECPVFLL